MDGRCTSSTVGLWQNLGQPKNHGRDRLRQDRVGSLLRFRTDPLVGYKTESVWKKWVKQGCVYSLLYIVVGYPSWWIKIATGNDKRRRNKGRKDMGSASIRHVPTTITVSSTNMLITWLSLELNLFSFIPLLINKSKNVMKSKLQLTIFCPEPWPLYYF